MVFVNLTKETSVNGIYQYDYGQILRIQGLDLPTAVEIHFSLTETEGEAVTRIGTTKDGVADVVIPDSMLENEDTEMDYNIYVFIYLADETSGETVKRITLKVKARPRPEAFDTPEDAKLFREAIKEVNNAADRAEEAERKVSEYAAQTKQDAEQTAEDRREVERIVETVSDIGEHVDTVREYRDQAQSAATNALLSEQKAAETKETVIAAQAGAESAANAAEEYAEQTAQDATQTAEDRAEVERLAAQVRKDKDAVAQSKTSVENTVQNFGQTVQQAKESVQSAGTGQISAVQSAGTQAVGQVNTAKGEAVKAVEDKGVEQVQALEDKGKEIIESFPTAPDLDAKLDKQQGAENAGKALVIGNDGNVVAGEVQTSIEVDATLTQQGKAADAKATGDKILQYAIKNTAQGESVVLQDSAEEKLLDMQMQGWTEQTKTEGKNLFELKKENLTNIKGKNVADIEGGIRFDYENLRDSWAEIDLNLKPNTTYTVYFGVKISNNNTTNYRIAWINKESDIDYFIEKSIAYSSEAQQNKYIRKTFTTPDTEEKIRFYLCGTRDYSGVSGYTEFTDFIIVEGEDSGLTYEPYTGGKPSPSPDYPQEIMSAGHRGNLFNPSLHEVDIKLTGKNLWNPVSEDYVQGVYRGWYIDTEAEYITLSIRNKDESVDVSGLYLGISANGVGSNLGVQWVSLNVGNSVNKVTLKHKYVTIYPPSDSNLQKLLDRFYIQVEEGRTATEYEEYKEQLVTLVSDRLITKFDRLEKRDEVWGWAFKTGTLNLADLDVVTVKDDGYTNNLTHRVYREIPDAVRNSEAFCNKLYSFKAGDITNIKVADYECCNISNGQYLQIKLLKERGTDAESIKSFFAENDIYVMYESIEEEFVPLSAEEQELLNNLYTYYPTTIVTNSENMDMQVQYVADTQHYVDNKFLSVAKQII